MTRRPIVVALAAVCLLALATPSLARHQKNHSAPCPESLPHCIGPKGSVSYSAPWRGQVNGRAVHGHFAVTITKKAKPVKRKAKAKKPRAAIAARAVRTAEAKPHQWGATTALVEIARSQIGNGAIYGRANLWCSRFMNWVAERAGKQGTGSDLAKSWASKPRVGPQVGAVAVMHRGRRGGHVGVVSGFDSRGNPIIISGNHNRRVAETVYPRGRVYAYVMP